MPILSTHYLIMNRFSALRGMMILLTNDFTEHQSSPLARTDLAAVWECLQALNRDQSSTVASTDPAIPSFLNGTEEAKSKRQEYYAFYNCGRASGCSREHKHMQIIPWHSYKPSLAAGKVLYPESDTTNGLATEPSTEEHRFELFEENLAPGIQVPMKKYGAMLDLSLLSSPATFSQHLIQTYESLFLSAAKALEIPVTSLQQAHQEAIEVPHNLVLTRTWMSIVPRRQALKGWAAANSSGAFADVWIKSEPEMEAWLRGPPSELLATFGVPV
jgi:ATP adenylyltransferase/5',5'''-P-1,P-4-tetraphosphate phosphorylase II